MFTGKQGGGDPRGIPGLESKIYNPPLDKNYTPPQKFKIHTPTGFQPKICNLVCQAHQRLEIEKVNTQTLKIIFQRLRRAKCCWPFLLTKV